VQRAAADVRTRLVEIAGSDELDAATFPELFVQHFGLAGGELIGRGEVAPEGTRLVRRGAGLLGDLQSALPRSRSIPRPATCACLKTATIADVGIAINPQLVERQDEGGTMQGLGNALFEEMVYQDGALLNPSMLEYRVPTMHDLPDSMTCIIVENADWSRPPTGRRAAARARWPAPPGRSPPRSPMPVVTVTELPTDARACLAFDPQRGCASRDARGI